MQGLYLFPDIIFLLYTLNWDSRSDYPIFFTNANMILLLFSEKPGTAITPPNTGPGPHPQKSSNLTEK